MSTLKESILQVHPQMEEFSRFVISKEYDPRHPYEPTPEFQKSAARAKQLRNLGNVAYQAKDYGEALQYYSMSVAAAPSDSQELALAYGNRSAVLQLYGKYALCLLDVNRALKNRPQISDVTKQKLVDRKIECWALLQSENKEKLVQRKAVKMEEKRALFPTERRWFYGHQMKIDESDLKMDYSFFDDPIWQTTFNNARMPSLSTSVDLVYNEEHGCHLIATKDIKPGEIISLQEVFALVLELRASKDVLQTYCSYCTIMCEALIPCPNCPTEMYCSRACLEKAYNSYHRTECKLLPILMSCAYAERRKVWLALRIFLTGTKQGLELESLMLNPDIFDILSGIKKFVSTPQHPTNDYFAILHTSWSASRDTHTLVLFSRILVDGLNDLEHFHNALYCMGLLEQTNFFDGIEETLQNPDNAVNVRLFAALLLLHHVESTDNYNYEPFVDLMMSSPTRVTQIKRQQVAYSFGLLQAFMNNSCDCNSFYTFNRRTVLTFASKPINAGEQVFANYGMLSKEYSKDMRSAYLMLKSRFKCQCKACLNDWPVNEQLAAQDLKIKTKEPKVIQKVGDYYAWLLQVKFPPSGGVYEYKDGDLQKALKYCQFIHQYVEEPSIIMNYVEYVIRSFMAVQGNCYFPATVKKISPPKVPAENIDPPENIDSSVVPAENISA